MTVIGALSSFRELGEMSPHKRCQHSGTGRSWKHPLFQLRCRLRGTNVISRLSASGNGETHPLR
jgi:hypothetical protein